LNVVDRGLPFVLALIFASAQLLADEPAAKKPAADGFVPLYNGDDLSGWEVTDGKLESWKAEGEVLSCVAEGGGWLRTNKKFSDFVLKLEYRIPAGGNSGVGLRLPPEGAPHEAGMEIQILDDDADEHKDLKPAQYTGSIYYQVAAKRGFAKPPGEWNTYEITCRGPLVKVVLNGETVTEASLDKLTKGEGGHPALADRPETGAIGLQSHGSKVEFRNVALKDLTSATNSGVSYVDVVEGRGQVVPAGATIAVHYTGRLTTGKKFDSSRDRGQPATFPLGNVIRGWSDGIPGMKVGGRRKLVIPAPLAYGEREIPGVIPANSVLIFDVEVLEIR
jgi:3-keto-disaccharide hydrolase/FKBP-type peptidyl-prolyl cis-trans isomerase